MLISPHISPAFLASVKYVKRIMILSLLILGIQALLSIYFPSVPTYANGFIFVVCFLSIFYLFFAMGNLMLKVDRQRVFLNAHGQQSSVKLISSKFILGFNEGAHSPRYLSYEVEFEGSHIMLIDQDFGFREKVGQYFDVLFDPMDRSQVSFKV